MGSAATALVLTGLCLTLGLPGGASSSTPQPSVEELVGQRLIVAMEGTTPSASLIARVRAGEVGGVILFGGNVRTFPQVRDLAARLQAAARAAGRPPLLVAVDQEGGSIRRLRWAPPARSAAELGALPELKVRATGRATALALRAVGVNVDLAPVADVPSVPGSFIAAQARAYASNPERDATLAAAFAQGLAEGGVAATAKHFPGLGRASASTDTTPVTIPVSRAVLASDLVSFRALIAARVPLVMLSNATYPALDAKPGAWSPAVQSLLRRTLGYDGVTITDALEAVAKTHRRSVAASAVLAAQSGADLLLITGKEAASDAVYGRLVAAAEAGTIPRPALERSYERILALKRSL
jgi:beta-N-acetylhexosaminidase